MCSPEDSRRNLRVWGLLNRGKEDHIDIFEMSISRFYGIDFGQGYIYIYVYIGSLHDLIPFHSNHSRTLLRRISKPASLGTLMGMRFTKSSSKASLLKPRKRHGPWNWNHISRLEEELFLRHTQSFVAKYRIDHPPQGRLIDMFRPLKKSNTKVK